MTPARSSTGLVRPSNSPPAGHMVAGRGYRRDYILANARAAVYVRSYDMHACAGFDVRNPIVIRMRNGAPRR
eukprot:14613571-Alexandrium_andersonii.AAC.1